MKSGIHSHHCTKHGARYECAKVTHCKQPDETVCPECRYAEMTGERAVCGRCGEDYPADGGPCACA